MLNHRGWILLSALTAIALSGCQLGTPEGKRADRLVLEGKHEAAEELYRMQLTRLESQLLDAPSPQLQNEHRELLEKLAKLNQHRLRRYEAAVNDWKRLIETHPNSELATEAGLAIAELYRYRLERPKDAIEAYEALRETLQDPTSRARVGLELADLLFDLKRFERVEVLSAEIEESNDDPKLDYRAAFLRARALTILERHSEAVEVWSSLELMEDPVVLAQILFEKSFALEASGRRVEAIECLHQALKHHPNPSLVQGMLKDLKTRTEMSEGGRAVHGSRAPARRPKARSQARQPPLTSSKKPSKRQNRFKVLRQSHAARPQRCQTRRLPHLKRLHPRKNQQRQRLKKRRK